MRARLAWVVGGLGVAAAVALRALRRPRGADAPAVAPDPRAEELRRKLAESRALVGERDEFEGGETTVDSAESVEPDAEARRRQVHEEARRAVDEMRGR